MTTQSIATSISRGSLRPNVRRTMGNIILMLLTATSLMGAPKKPDFSGRWELDQTRSQLRHMTKWDSLVLAIEHQDPRLNISMTTKYSDGSDFTRLLPLTTDGKDVSMDGKGKSPRIYRASWSGARLIVRWNEGAGITETWILSPDGKTMTIAGSSSAADGKPESWKYVMMKK